MTDQPALALHNVSKHYGPVQVLDNISLQVQPGQVHALLGSNGAGKSTLVKIMSGIVAPDSGSTLELWGREVPLPFSSAHEHGLAVIHQDLGLMESMTVWENLGASSGYGTGVLGRIRRSRERAVCREVLDQVDLDVSLDALIADLSPAMRAGVAIARARRLMQEDPERSLFILDEPTAYLNARESDAVMRLMRRVADRGSGVVFISHRLNEVMDVSDHVSVLRDGRVADSFPAVEGDKERVISAMLGRQLEEPYPQTVGPATGRPTLVVDDLTADTVQGLSFQAASGEILGFAGLVGMGHEEVPYLLAGVAQSRGGTVTLGGTELAGLGIRDRIAAGLVLVPGNRQRDGLWPDGTASENVLLTRNAAQTVWKRLDKKSERSFASTLLRQFDVRPPLGERPAVQFSGGNQQKIVLAKWLSLEPRVLLMDEPTQGVDVGAKFEVLSQVSEAAKRGSTVLLSSGDYEQLAAMCHRVLVLRHGSIVAELRGTQLTEAAIATAAQG